ncbi:phosphatidylserine/phosphatidylglycerophosphate/cardiolipin synthase family protein [Mangrovimonas sp. YM274]|uniref:phospholipase D-like domain-containing protein n=1 Tax=Mangrovimonas sp. YM274 TaxID=3070660 RepID=UPI0027DDDFEC|nr:phospholipase D-like domain-containing protein [Mangrovimonas sp. YM274]WMI68152.1 phospholipase D-like domain-containing protein [Mangrovimonas sp. YM274]
MNSFLKQRNTVLFLKCCIALVVFVLTSCSKDEQEVNHFEVETEVNLDITFPEVLFTDVAQIAQRNSSKVILNRLIQLVDAAPQNSTIHISISAFQYTPLINALLRADNKGVAVSIIIDYSLETGQTNNLNAINLLRDGFSSNSKVTLLTNDSGAIAINHNKFALFSKVNTVDGEKENVVFQTSHNFAEASTKKAQDAVIFSNEDLYSSFLNYWDDMKSLAVSGMVNYYYREFISEDINAYFFPKRREGEFYGEDTIIEILDDIQNPENATIKIGMSIWTDSRIAIVAKLSELIDEGATVEVIVKPSVGDNVFNALLELEAKGAFIKAFSNTNIHSKYMIIDADWQGTHRKIVVTGSHNYSQNALRYNNETLLLIKDDLIFSEYDTNFNQLKELENE